MKYTLSLFSVFFVLVACKSTAVTSESNENSVNTSTNSVPTKLHATPSKTESVSSKTLQETVEFLASDALKGRETGTEGIEQAASFIESKFLDYNLKPYFKTYRDSFKVGSKQAYNIVGFLEGQNQALKDEIILIGAHYDHIGYGKVIGNDSIANGANDNAAGTVAVLELANYFSKYKTNGRSLMFVLFSAEEIGLLGSKHLAKKLKKESVDLYTVLNFEMIGVPFTDRDYVAFVTGYHVSNMAQKINEYAGFKLVGLSDVAKKYQLFKASDNYPFYQTFKIPSQTISSCDLSNYDYYHHVDDEANQLDYTHMASIINKMIPVIEKVSQTATKEIVLYEE